MADADDTTGGGGRLASLSPRTRLVLALVGLVVGVLLILFGVGVLDNEATTSNSPTTTQAR